MKPVPQALLEGLQHLAPPGAEVVPLDWAYDGEDYNLAVFVDDEAHGTFTMCMVRPKRERTRAGMR